MGASLRAPDPIARMRAIVRDPLATAVRLRAQRDRGALLRRQARLARRVGLDRPYLILSFDCDTAADAEAVPAVHERLAGLGVTPTYAVPGALLRQAAAVYGPLAAAGVEFLNHGGVEHTYFDEALGRQASCFFYDELDEDRIRQDVEDGHAAVSEVTGAAPSGFRTPHFGTFQKPDQLRFLHATLARLGYRFSTSTVPRVALRHGPVTARFGLPEVPVTGIPAEPFSILDTWAFFAAPARTYEPGDYVEQARAVAEAVGAAGAGVINVYGDPLHVRDRDEFFAAVELWAGVAEPVSYAELLDRVRL